MPHQSRPIVLPAPFALIGAELFLGQGSNALEVVRCQGLAANQLVEVWKARRGGRASPVLIVSSRADSLFDLCGVDGESPPVIRGISASQCNALTEHAVDLPDRHTAIRFCSRALESLDTAHPGTRNSGLLTTHMVENGIQVRTDYAAACLQGERVLGKTGTDLIRALGFTATTHKHVQLVRSKERKIAVAVLLQRDETPDAGTQRLGNLSPVSYAFAEADKENVDYVLLVQDSVIRLYPTAMNIGVGRRSRTETFLEIDVRLLPPAQAGLLWLAFSADALMPDGSLQELLNESGRFAGALAINLRERIYGKVMPLLATAIADARPGNNKTVDKLAETYQMAVTVLFRLLFIAYAEDKDLLPYKVDERYRGASLKRLASELQAKLTDSERYGSGRYLWDRISTLFNAVSTGNELLGVPQYNGGLFSDDRSISPSGYYLSKLVLTDANFGPAIEHLLLIEDSESHQLGPVDFRSLSVREFGTVYEGLLESALSVAETDLSLDKEEHYVPSKPRDEVAVGAGEFYLHNKSGARKASGSYFTKEFAVSALLDSALEPALLEHCARLDALDEVEAGLAFFDFRACDLAMGSGHFLIAAVDRIEKSFSGYLARRNLPLVRKEFSMLRNSAMGALKRYADSYEIEDAQLLRRQIAKRCIYGVDLNETSVQLARLAVWIHTFVPGLPLSFLDHNLAHGNSLVGIGTVQEMDLVKKQLADDEDQLGFISTTAEDLLSSARKHLQRLAAISDATYDEVQKSRIAREEASKAIANTSALFDVSIADRIRERGESAHLSWEHVSGDTPVSDSAAHKWASKKLGGLHPLHFPARFPEVFLRENASGFDVLLGNPPWEKVMFEEPVFWMRQIPGFRGLGQADREKAVRDKIKQAPDILRELEKERELADVIHEVLTRAVAHPFGASHPDLYQAFAWRFWDLLKQGGHIGLVLPRTAFGGDGLEEWRRTILTSGSKIEVTVLENKKEWVFDGIHQQYTVALFSAHKGLAKGDSSLFIDGPYRLKEDFFARAAFTPSDAISGATAQGWSKNAALPLLPSRETLRVFVKMRQQPSFGKVSGLRPQQALNASLDKHLFEFTDKPPKRYWAVFKGESFDLWNPDRGNDTYYGWADPDKVIERLMDKRRNSRRREDSPYMHLSETEINDPTTLDCFRPRIAFRDVTNRTNTRTIVCALIPGQTFAVHISPTLYNSKTAAAEAFYLACLSSRSLDWFARRWIELHLTFTLLDTFPVPSFDSTSKLHSKVVNLSARLAAVDKRYATWAKSCGVEYGPLPEVKKREMLTELEALVAKLYGFDKADVSLIYQTFHSGWDYRTELAAVLAHF